LVSTNLITGVGKVHEGSIQVESANSRVRVKVKHDTLSDGPNSAVVFIKTQENPFSFFLMTSPLKTGAFKNREFVYELLILNRRNIHEKIKVYRSTDRLCHQAGRDWYTRRGSVPQNGNQ